MQVFTSSPKRKMMITRRRLDSDENPGNLKNAGLKWLKYPLYSFEIHKHEGGIARKHNSKKISS